MKRTSLTSLRAIARNAGEMFPIEQVNNGSEQSFLQLFKKDGFEYFSRSEANIVAMACQAVLDCLEKSGLRAVEIAAVIFCTESFWDTCEFPLGSHNFAIRESFIKCVADLGLSNAIVYANWLQGCANFTSCLSLANALVTSSQHENVLVVLSDRMVPEKGRVSEDGATVYSDGATAFIVDRRDPGFRIEGISLHFSPSVLTTRNERNFRQHGKATAIAFGEFRNKIERDIPHKLEEHDILLTDNLNSVSLAFLCSAMAIESHKLSQPTKYLGHSFSGDCPSSLAAIQEKLRCGDRVGLLNIGPSNFGFTSLRLVTSVAAP